MRLEIVGVGQMYDLDSSQMRNHLQVRGPGGLVTVFTDEDTVQQLLNIVAGVPVTGDGHEHEFDVHEQSVQEKAARLAQTEDVPPGAAIFGGDTDQEEQPMDSSSEEDEDSGQASDPVSLRNRARKKRGKPKIKDLVQSYHDDDSGVAVHDLPADEKGNPLIPGGLPDSTMEDEEEDPGEAGQI